MIVVDTNVIAYLLIPGAHTAAAQRALQRDPDWQSPVLWRSELQSVLVQYLSGGHLDLGRAGLLLDEAVELMRGREHQVLGGDVLRLAAASRCSAYDCEFVALAEDLGVRLVTTDKRVLRAFPGRAVDLRAFAEGRR